MDKELDDGMEQEHPKLGFIRLLKKCEEFGFKSEDFDSLQVLCEIRNHSKNDRHQNSLITTTWTLTKIVVIVVFILMVVWVVNWPIKRHDLASGILSIKGINSKYQHEEECILEFPGDAQKYFRPPVTCDFCRNVTHIPRISGITPEEFDENYAYSGHPIVIVDATTSWTAMDAYSFKFFQDVFKNVSSSNNEHQTIACQFFPYKTKFKSLDDVFNMSLEKAYMKDGSPPWYIGWKNCDFTVGSILRQHYTRPYFLPVLAESSKTDWIFMGSPGYGAHLHIDNVGNPSWQAQITGHKRWILEPPPECYYTCTSHMETVVKPGEIMVINANLWYHQTIIEGDEIAIAIGSEYD